MKLLSTLLLTAFLFSCGPQASSDTAFHRQAYTIVADDWHPDYEFRLEYDPGETRATEAIIQGAIYAAGTKVRIGDFLPNWIHAQNAGVSDTHEIETETDMLDMLHQFAQTMLDACDSCTNKNLRPL